MKAICLTKLAGLAASAELAGLAGQAELAELAALAWLAGLAWATVKSEKNQADKFLITPIHKKLQNEPFRAWGDQGVFLGWLGRPGAAWGGLGWLAGLNWLCWAGWADWAGWAGPPQNLKKIRPTNS